MIFICLKETERLHVCVKEREILFIYWFSPQIFFMFRNILEWSWDPWIQYKSTFLLNLRCQIYKTVSLITRGDSLGFGMSSFPCKAPGFESCFHSKFNFLSISILGDSIGRSKRPAAILIRNVAWVSGSHFELGPTSSFMGPWRWSEGKWRKKNLSLSLSV